MALRTCWVLAASCSRSCCRDSIAPMKRALSRKNLWEASPPVFKAVVGRALRMVPIRYLLGMDFARRYEFLQDAQWWDTERIRDYQLKRLKRILTLAYESTEYYRESLQSVGFEPGDFKEISDLAGLPTINRNTVRANLHRMMTKPADHRTVDYVTTSGTGGSPLALYMDSTRHAPEFAHLAVSWLRVGYRPGMPMAVLRGKPVPLDRSGMRHCYDGIMRQDYYSSFHLCPEQMRLYVRHMHKARPAFLHAYPSSAYTLSRFMANEGLSYPPSVRAILLESEPVYPHQARYTEEHFPLRVFSSYGHTEKLVLAAECEHSRLYHVWPTYGYCEVLDAGGQPVRSGERGEITGTGFINEVVPFIRYRTDDYATFAGTACRECGRQHLLLADVRGHRSQEFLVTRDARTIIAWTMLNMHDDTFDGIIRFQFVQEQAGYARLLMVPAPRPAKYDLDRIRRHLEQKVCGQIEIELHICEEIPPAKGGKNPIVIQRTPGIEALLSQYEKGE